MFILQSQVPQIAHVQCENILFFFNLVLSTLMAGPITYFLVVFFFLNLMLSNFMVAPIIHVITYYNVNTYYLCYFLCCK